ncbi:MAG: c-type cytochrome [Pseudomonadota bacterium]
MDTMFWTRVMGGLCGSLLFFLMVNWGAEELYHVGGHDYAHDDAHSDDDHGEDKKTALAWIVVEEINDPGDPIETVEVAFEEVFATADAGAGERVWGKCRSCHKLGDGENGTGPHLHQILDRQIAAVAEYNYSNSLADLSGEAWTAENLNGFIENPRGWAPGTKMSFNGISSVEDRANLIAYLEQGGS